MNKEQIIEALVPIYNTVYDEYFHLTELSTQLLYEGEEQTFLVLSRKATQKSYFMDGLKAAAGAMGVSNDEFSRAAAKMAGIAERSESNDRSVEK